MLFVFALATVEHASALCGFTIRCSPCCKPDFFSDSATLLTYAYKLIYLNVIQTGSWLTCSCWWCCMASSWLPSSSRSTEGICMNMASTSSCSPAKVAFSSPTCNTALLSALLLIITLKTHASQGQHFCHSLVLVMCLVGKSCWKFVAGMLRRSGQRGAPAADVDNALSAACTTALQTALYASAPAAALHKGSSSILRQRSVSRLHNCPPDSSIQVPQQQPCTGSSPAALHTFSTSSKCVALKA